MSFQRRRKRLRRHARCSRSKLQAKLQAKIRSLVERATNEHFGRWLEEGASKFKSDMQDAQEKFDQFGGQARDAAKEATGAIIRLPNARPLTARERCAPAPNNTECPTEIFVTRAMCQ